MNVHSTAAPSPSLLVFQTEVSPDKTGDFVWSTVSGGGGGGSSGNDATRLPPPPPPPKVVAEENTQPQR